eukprot:2934483-Pleurochrysis_carterae.AAC.3
MLGSIKGLRERARERRSNLYVSVDVCALDDKLERVEGELPDEPAREGARVPQRGVEPLLREAAAAALVLAQRRADANVNVGDQRLLLAPRVGQLGAARLEPLVRERTPLRARVLVGVHGGVAFGLRLGRLGRRALRRRRQRQLLANGVPRAPRLQQGTAGCQPSKEHSKSGDCAYSYRGLARMLVRFSKVKKAARSRQTRELAGK